MNKVLEIESLYLQDYGWMNTGNTSDVKSIQEIPSNNEIFYKCYNEKGEVFRVIKGRFVIFIDYK